MSWEKKSVSKLCEFAIDCVNKTAPVVDYETPFKMIRTTNVKGGFIDLETVRYVDEETFKKWTRRSKPSFGDVIFTREAPVGDVGRFTSNDKNVFLGQRLFHYRPNSELLDWQFLAYILQSAAVQGWVHGIAFGATVPHIKVEDAENLKIPYPPIKIQRKIGKILSAYDDLIENNLQRIKLLEDMAQITYKEWFVRMKFPDHEHTPIDPESGLPEGWVRSPLANHLKFIKGKKVEETFRIFSSGLKKVLLLNSLEENGNYLYTNPKGHVTANRGDLLMLMDGARSSCPFYAHDGVVGSTMAKVMSKGIPTSLLYQFFNVYLEWLQINNTGAAIPHANKSFINGIEFILPNQETLQKWNEFINPINESLWLLKDENNLLKEARDILLPRLMTGMIDVETIELPEALLARMDLEASAV